MKKWKVELWLEDTPPEDDGTHLLLEDIISAMINAKTAIVETWTGLSVVDFDAYEDKEDDLSKREGL